MILTILVTIFFFLAFLVFSVLGYKRRNGWVQFVALNSFIAGSNSLKEILSPNYTNIVNITRIIIGLLVISVFIYLDFQN